MAFSRLHGAQTDDQELLSAYLDNQLSVTERIALERRLQTDLPLQAELQELRMLKTLLSELQPVVPPRSFSLDPATVRRPIGLPLFNLLRLGSALATVLLVLTFTADFIRTSVSPEATTARAPAAAQAPAAEPSSGTFSAADQAAAPAANTDAQSTTEGGASAALSAPATPVPALQAPASAADQPSTSMRQSKLQASSATTDTTSVAAQPPEVVQPGQLHASDSSSPGTGESALPSEARSIATNSPTSNALLRWLQVTLGIVAIALALGAWLAWRQSR